MSLPSAEVAPSAGPAAAGPAPSAEHRPAVTPSSANVGFELTDPTPAPLHSPSEADSENEALPRSRVDDPDSVPSRPRFPPSPPPALSFEMLYEDLDPPPGRSFDLLQEDFEGSVNDFGRSEGLASSMSFLDSDGDGADWYEGVRDASESHFSLVPSANLETSPQEAQPGRIASVVASERSRTALPVPALPWERGVFRSIFGDEGVSNPFDSLVLRMPMPLVPAHVPSTSKELPEPPMPTGDIASRAFKSFKDQHPSEERDMIMDRAICKLQHIVGRTEVIRLSSLQGRLFLAMHRRRCSRL